MRKGLLVVGSMVFVLAVITAVWYVSPRQQRAMRFAGAREVYDKIDRLRTDVAVGIGEDVFEQHTSDAAAELDRWLNTLQPNDRNAEPAASLQTAFHAMNAVRIYGSSGLWYKPEIKEKMKAAADDAKAALDRAKQNL